MTVCSTAFESLGHGQARALGYQDLPILVAPHPFGALKRDQVRDLAAQCIGNLLELPLKQQDGTAAPDANAGRPAKSISVDDDIEAVNRLFRERHWTDGLPIVPPTPERVRRMLTGTMHGTARKPDEVVAQVAPGFGTATVERIAINAVMAGCEPAYLPVLIAAVEAACAPEFNLQGIQATTNPVAVWLIVNGPIVKALEMNFGPNCLGQGNWANATLGRALHLVLQNVGGAVPGDMDRATHGQPGKFLFCCAENEDENPWEPLQVERGFTREQSTVTVVGAEGTTNMNTHSKDAEDILRVVAETMKRPAGNDYRTGGEPWMIFSPEHADVLKSAGYSKAQVKQRLWEDARMPARLQSKAEHAHTVHARKAELGEITPDTLLPYSKTADMLGIIVAGGPGTHSVLVSSFGNTRSVTREIK